MTFEEVFEPYSVFFKKNPVGEDTALVENVQCDAICRVMKWIKENIDYLPALSSVIDFHFPAPGFFLCMHFFLFQPGFRIGLQRLDLFAFGARPEGLPDEFVKLFYGEFFVPQLGAGGGRGNVQDARLIDAVGQVMADKPFLDVGQLLGPVYIKQQFYLRIDLVDVLPAAAGTAAGAEF